MPEILGKPPEMGIQSQMYRFFDQTIELRSNDLATLELMNGMYKRFATNCKSGICYEALATNQPMICTPHHNYQVKKASLLPAITHGIILRNTFSKIRSHLLFHAAALSYKNKGIIIVAESGFGKTTLTLSLVKQGYQFLSDEIAALSLESGQVTPYPRCLWIRAGTQAIFEKLQWQYPNHHVSLNIKNRKAIHLAEDLLSNACSPNFLIIIAMPSYSSERHCIVTLDRITQELITTLQTIKNFKLINTKIDDFPRLQVPAKTLQQIYKISEQLNVLVLNVEETAVPSDFFDNVPELRKMSKMQAIMELLRSFSGGYHSALLQQDYQGSFLKMLEILTKLLKYTECYQLTPGRLDKMVECFRELQRL